jgi:predicted lactoylglutathione lyase
VDGTGHGAARQARAREPDPQLLPIPRAEVDEMLKKAVIAGGKHVTDPQDHGFMYGWSFYDPDGHHWEVRLSGPGGDAAGAAGAP